MNRRTFLEASLGALVVDRAGGLMPGPVRDVRSAVPTFHVRKLGARGDGLTDDTSAFARATAAGAAAGVSRIIVERGTYVIDADVDRGLGVRLPSNCAFVMQPGAVLRAKASGLGRSGVILLHDVSHTDVHGGRIEGERRGHTGTTGEWGMGIWMNSAHHCGVHSTTIRGCWGDGIYVGSVAPNAGDESSDIVIDGVRCEDNRRQGISVVSAKRVVIRNSTLSGTGGTMPGAGIDFEPDEGTAVVEDCVVQDCTFEDNAVGVQLVGACRRIRVTRNHFRRNRTYGILLVRVRDGDIVSNQIEQSDVNTSGIVLEASRGARINGNHVSGRFKEAVEDHDPSANTHSGNTSARTP